MEQRATERIDSHHHLWQYSPVEYGWIDDSMEMLRRDFLPTDLAKEIAAARIDGTIAVQARQSLEETDWLLSLAHNTPAIRGVVGWAPIADREFSETLQQLNGQMKLKGLRHVIQAEPDPNYILRPSFNAGIDAMLGTGLVYDILIYEKHLPQAIEFVDQHPNQVFVLDHIAKPRIADNLIEPWATTIRELGERPNVWCKVSGIVTEADWKTWSAETLRPYLDVVVDAFGPKRLMAGSDWPVCLVASGYGQWFKVLEDYFSAFSESERASVFGGTATGVYRL